MDVAEPENDRRWKSRDDWRISAILQHALRMLNPTPQAVSKGLITRALVYVLRNCRPDDFRNRLAVHRRHRLEFFGLLRRESNGHRLSWLHAVNRATCHLDCQVARWHDTVVSW